jgi:hypothetical protein
MNTSFSKRRHLSEANERLEKRFLESKKIISEAPEVQPKVEISDMISLTQDILKQNGAQFNIGDYVNTGDNPMCVPDNDTSGILDKVFDFFNNLGTTTELESAISDVLQGQSVGGIQIPDELKNDAAVIGAGLLAADENEGEGEEITEQGINYRKRSRKQRRRKKRAKCGRTGKRNTQLRDRIKAGGV